MPGRGNKAKKLRGYHIERHYIYLNGCNDRAYDAQYNPNGRKKTKTYFIPGVEDGDFTFRKAQYDIIKPGEPNVVYDEEDKMYLPSIVEDNKYGRFYLKHVKDKTNDKCEGYLNSLTMQQLQDLEEDWYKNIIDTRVSPFYHNTDVLQHYLTTARLAPIVDALEARRQTRIAELRQDLQIGRKKKSDSDVKLDYLVELTNKILDIGTNGDEIVVDLNTDIGAIKQALGLKLEFLKSLCAKGAKDGAKVKRKVDRYYVGSDSSESESEYEDKKKCDGLFDTDSSSEEKESKDMKKGKVAGDTKKKDIIVIDASDKEAEGTKEKEIIVIDTSEDEYNK